MKALRITALIALGLWMTLRTLHAFAGETFESYVSDSRAAVAAVETQGDRELAKRQKAAEAAIGTFERDIQTLESRKSEIGPNLASAEQKLAALTSELEQIESSKAYLSASKEVAERTRLGRFLKADPQALKDRRAKLEEIQALERELDQWKAEQAKMDSRIAAIRDAQGKAAASALVASAATELFLSDKRLTEKDGRAVATDELKLREARAAADRMTQGWETEGLDTRLLLSDYKSLKTSGKLTELEIQAAEEKLSRALDSSYLGEYIESKFKGPGFCERVRSCSREPALSDRVASPPTPGPSAGGASEPAASEESTADSAD